MQIGTQYADNKIYKGIKHYDSYPLTSGDIHERADTLQKKTEFLLDNLVGSGIINKPNISISADGVSLLEPSVLLLNGDISLIQTDDFLLKTADIQSSGITDGYVCVVGWDQHISANSTLRSYGGVMNSVLENELFYPQWNVQISSRYQFRWDIIVVDKSVFDDDSDIISLSIPTRDFTGELSSEDLTTIETASRIGAIRVASKPDHMDYALSDLYIIPVLSYTYGESNYEEVEAIKPLSITTKSVKLRRSLDIPTAYEEPSNITIDINVEDFNEEDLIEVNYNGLVLYEDINYTIDYETSTITLLEFTTEIGDKLIIEVTRNG